MSKPSGPLTGDELLDARCQELAGLRRRRDECTSLSEQAELTQWIDELLAEIGSLRIIRSPQSSSLASADGRRPRSRQSHADLLMSQVFLAIQTWPIPRATWSIAPRSCRCRLNQASTGKGTSSRRHQLRLDPRVRSAHVSAQVRQT